MSTPGRVGAEGVARTERRPKLPRRLSFKRPKGEQLEEFLEEFVASLEPDEMVPSERALAERYDVARMTVRQGLDRLESKGLIYRVQGRGTFVAKPKITQSEALTSFTEDMRARGMEPGSTVLSQEIAAAHEIPARELGIDPGTPVVVIERIRTADGEPIAYERAYLPAERFAGLEDADLTDGSMYELLQKRWGVRLHDARQRVSAVTVDDAEAELLHIRAGGPAFLFQRTTHDSTGAVVEYVRSLYRGDRYEVDTHLERRK
jgi:GntR family transcriptional regulator